MAAASAPPAVKLPPGQVLDAQQGNRLRQCMRHIDAQEYAKAIRVADSILEEFPDHAETLAMKAVALHGNDRKDGDDGAYAVAKLAIQKYMKSCVAWHSLGIIHRRDKNYIEAMKCCKMAMRLDVGPGEANANLIRDLSTLSIHLRDWETFESTRQKALNQKGNVRFNWIALAAAHHAQGHYAMADAIVTVMAMAMDTGDNDVERSEVNLYRAEVALLAGLPQKAVEILEQSKTARPGTSGFIADEIAAIDVASRAYENAGRNADAESCLWILLGEKNCEQDRILQLARLRGIAPFPKVTRSQPVTTPDHLKCVGGLPDFSLLQTAEQRRQFLALLDDVKAKLPKCELPLRLALDVTNDEDDFRARFISFARPYIVKMISSLSSVVKSLYDAAALGDGTSRQAGAASAAAAASGSSSAQRKLGIIEELLLQWRDKLQRGEFDIPALFPAGAPALAKDRNPQLVVWIFVFLATHYQRSGRLTEALAEIEKAIAHTPTIEMLYLFKAKILQKSGRLAEAAAAADFARKLDLQDKYLNGKAAKYFFRAGDVAQADATLAIFHKPSPVKDTHLTMFESQCTWYEIECGDAFAEKGDLVTAIQHYKLIEKHNDDNHAELFDFHSYTLRRCNIRSWIDVVFTEDHFGSTKFYLEAAPKLISVYIKVFDDKEGEAGVRSRFIPRPPIDFDNATFPTPAERTDAQKHAEQLEKDFILQVDLSEPLKKCEPYLAALATYAPHEVSSHELAFEVHLRAQRPVLCAKAIVAVSRLPGSKAAKKAVALTQSLKAWLSTSAAAVDARVRAAVTSVLARIEA